MEQEKQRVAIFDVDGTLFRSSLLIELVETLIAEGVFPASARDKYDTFHFNWANREGGYEEYIDTVVQTFVQHLRGVPYDDFSRACRSVVAVQSRRVYRFTRDLARKLKEDGYYLLAISQSPKTILDPFCAELGFDKVYGRIYEIGPQDRLTGRIVDEHLIANKANIVRRAVEKENLTLADSVGVGDTDGDIPLLELVERAICFNPNSVLYRHARRNGWRIVVERKDVVYELSPDCGIIEI